MKIPSYDFWAPLIFFIGVPIVRAAWVVATTGSSRFSTETGPMLFLDLAVPPIICGLLLLKALDIGGKRFERLRLNKAALKYMMLVGFVTSIVAGSMFIFLAGSYWGKVPEMFLNPTIEDWAIFAKGTAMMSAMFIVPIGLAVYGEAKDRRSSKK